jgi:predicted lipoprotein with Yx(FWY)xxD motif
VKTASNSAIGKTVLVDAHGMTLYRLSGESATNFICKSSACTAVWHPLAAPSGGAPTGVSSLGTVTRPDGSSQVTYKGEPLYTFASDKAPGDANGQGLKDVGTWEAVSTGGGASSTPAPPPTTSSSSSGGGGYGY